MIKEKTITPLENSAVKLEVTIEQTAAEKEYQALLTDYSKKAHLKGFRPGKAPIKVLETKFGESMRMETAQKIIEDTLKVLFEQIEEKPLGYATPSLEGELVFDPKRDFTFAVSYDVFPTFEVKDTSGIAIEEPQVSIEKEDLSRELEALREQNALVVEKSDGVVEKNTIVTVNYAELDEKGVVIDGTNREDYTFTVGSGYTIYKFDEDIVGMKVGDEKTFTKDIEGEEAKTVTLKVSVTKIKVRELPDLDDELAQDIDDAYKTLEDLKKSIQTRLEESAKSQVRQKNIATLLDGLVEKNPLTVPESMVHAELHSNWNNFLRQFGGNESMVHQLLQAQGSSQAQLFDEWKPDAQKRLKGQLILQKLIEKANIEVTDEEVDAEIKTQAAGSNMGEKETREYFEKNGLLDYVRNDIKERKMYDLLFEKNPPKKGPKVKYLDLMERKS
ncbi:MAG: trigger factor [Spirochaetales bacterium]|nr:trigger factor [Spirochaetales bacterium]